MFSLKRLTSLLILAMSLLLLLPSCSKEDPDAIAEKDREKLLKYIRDNDMEDEVIEDESGLFYVVEEPGSGPNPDLYSLIRIKYTGMLLDGTVFDDSPGALIQLANTIEGWRIGIPKFKVGGKGILLVPSALAYGGYPPFGSSIPRHACLVFEFTIIDIN